MINEKLLATLAPLNIPVHFMEAQTDEGIYIIFGTTGVDDSFYCDDEADAEVTRVSIVLWYNAEQSMEAGTKIRELKSLMKSEGFIKQSERDLKDGAYYGRSFYYSKLDYK